MTLSDLAKGLFSVAMLIAALIVCLLLSAFSRPVVRARAGARPRSRASGRHGSRPALLDA